MKRTKKTVELPANLARVLEMGKKTQPQDIDPNFELIKLLGYGYEGYVYLIRDHSNGRQLVLKIFHDPFDHEPWIWQGLDCYVSSVEQNSYGLYSIKGKYVSDQVVAIHYPYEKLHPLSTYLLRMSLSIRQSLVAQFCQMQAYLFTRHRIGIVDPGPRNFLFDRKGQYHYVDFGLGIRTLDEPITQDCGLFAFGFAAMLLGVHTIILRAIRQPSPGYDYSQPCRYNTCPELQAIAATQPWVRKILDQIEQSDGTIFLDPDFYRRVGSSLPQRIKVPLFWSAASEGNLVLRRVKNWVKNLTPIGSG